MKASSLIGDELYDDSNIVKRSKTTDAVVCKMSFIGKKPRSYEFDVCRKAFSCWAETDD